MPRAFRHSPPTALATMVDRRRLSIRLDQRWDRRLTTIVAGPGFGKTMLLARALATAPGGRPGQGQDIWLSCEPADASGDHLVRSLVETSGLGTSADLDGLLSAIWSHAPEHICIVLDDVHEIPDDSDGAQILDRILTDLPRNGHLVLASRDPVPVRTARLAAAGELDRITEADLILDSAELTQFARARHVDRHLLDSTGGWPALAELTASAGADLVLDYLWDEVLANVGPERTRQLAQLAVVGDADDEVASALAGSVVRVDDLVAGIPLVLRSTDGSASLHALWGPALRPHLDDDAARSARRAAAAVHRTRGRYQTAVDLLAEAEAWDEVIALVRDAELNLILPSPGTDIGRWCDVLPPDRRTEPEVLLAVALERRGSEPVEALPVLAGARDAFAARGDTEGEAATLAQEGLVRWWSHDIEHLVVLIARIHELAAQGSELAQTLSAIGGAAVAHLGGDSDGVRTHLDGIDQHVPDGWRATVQWLRSVAHRRDGDLDLARRALEGTPTLALEGFRHELESAELRTAWLEGDVDETSEGWARHCDRFVGVGDSYLTREVTLEFARVEAWLGRPEHATALVRGSQNLTTMESPLSRILGSMAAGAAAVAEGDEASAAEILRAEVTGALGGSDAWYWRDRATIALTHVLVPESRDAWSAEPLGSAHRPGIDLAMVLESVRAGDLEPIRALAWPTPGVVRAHLPLPWVAELIAAAAGAQAPAPPELVRAVEHDLRATLRTVAESHPVPAVAGGARQLLGEIPARPATPIRIQVMGPLGLWREGTRVEGPEIQRRRVRELLCSIVAHTTIRRESLAAELWPDHPDPRQNLRVNLAYLQRALQPERETGEAPYFLRTDGTYLRLDGGDLLEVDVWQLDTRLDEGEAADRAGSPAAALAAYQAAAELWTGEPYQDAPDAPWVEQVRARLSTRFVAGMLRAGELLLATGEFTEARRLGNRAVAADRWSEPGHQLVIRAHLAAGDRGGAAHALDACRVALAELDLEPTDTTRQLLV